MPAELLPAAVLIEIQSKVITVKLFDDYIETPVKNKLVAALNGKCIADQATFENQCCPGRAWTNSSSTKKASGDCIDSVLGVSFLNKFTDGTTFKFNLIAKGDPASKCCTTSSSSATNITRAKRATDGGNLFDQDVLLGIINDPTTGV